MNRTPASRECGYHARLIAGRTELEPATSAATYPYPIEIEQLKAITSKVQVA
jgi:hypothetical protein